jgi:hypothetical protein
LNPNSAQESLAVGILPCFIVLGRRAERNSVNVFWCGKMAFYVRVCE